MLSVSEGDRVKLKSTATEYLNQSNGHNGTVLAKPNRTFRRDEVCIEIEWDNGHINNYPLDVLKKAVEENENTEVQYNGEYPLIPGDRITIKPSSKTINRNKHNNTDGYVVDLPPQPYRQEYIKWFIHPKERKQKVPVIIRLDDGRLLNRNHDELIKIITSEHPKEIKMYKTNKDIYYIIEDRFDEYNDNFEYEIIVHGTPIQETKKWGKMEREVLIRNLEKFKENTSQEEKKMI